MIVTVLGSGSSVPTARRAQPGYLVEWTGGALLIDPSAGSYSRALKAGLEPARLLAVALTHFHLDHVGDLPNLAWVREQMNYPPIPVAGPAGTRAFLETLDGVFEWREFPCEFDGMLIQAFAAKHTPEAVCLRLCAGGKTFAYSGDTADCPGVREACRDADLAILECTAASGSPEEGHMTPADVAAVVEAARPRKFVMSHLRHDNVAEMVGPDVVFESADGSELPPAAEDGLVFTV